MDTPSLIKLAYYNLWNTSNSDFCALLNDEELAKRNEPELYALRAIAQLCHFKSGFKDYFDQIDPNAGLGCFVGLARAFSEGSKMNLELAFRLLDQTIGLKHLPFLNCFFRMFIYSAIGETRKSEEQVNLCRSYADHEFLSMFEARIHHIFGAHNEVLMSLNETIPSEVVFPENLVMKARVFAEMHNYEAAIAVWDHLIERDKSNVDYVFQKMDIVSLFGDKRHALELSIFYLRHFPDNLGLHLYLLQNAALLSEFELGEWALKKAIECGAEAEGILVGKGLLLLQREKYLEGLEVFSEWIAILEEKSNPADSNLMRNLSTAYNNRAACYNGLKRFEEACDDLHLALSIDAKNEVAISSLANVEYSLKRYSDALKSVDHAIERDKLRGDHYVLRANIKLKLEKPANDVFVDIFKAALVQKLSNKSGRFMAEQTMMGFPIFSYAIFQRLNEDEQLRMESADFSRLAKISYKFEILNRYTKALSSSSLIDNIALVAISSANLFLFGDPVNVYNHLQWWHKNDNLTMQGYYYYLLSALAILPDKPDMGVKQQVGLLCAEKAIQALQNPKSDDRTLYYSILILLYTGEHAPLNDILNQIPFASLQIVFKHLLKAQNPDAQAPFFSQTVIDYVVPYEPIVLSTDTAELLEQLNGLFRYYENASYINTTLTQSKEVLPFWDALDISLIEQLIISQRRDKLFQEFLKGRIGELKITAETKAPDITLLSDSTDELKHVLFLESSSSLKELISHIEKTIRENKISRDVVAKMVEYIYLKGKLNVKRKNADDPVELSKYDPQYIELPEEEVVLLMLFIGHNCCLDISAITTGAAESGKAILEELLKEIFNEVLAKGMLASTVKILGRVIFSKTGSIIASNLKYEDFKSQFKVTHAAWLEEQIEDRIFEI